MQSYYIQYPPIYPNYAHHKDRLLLAMIWSKEILVQQRRHEARLKILTAEVVSLSLISYPKTKTATFTQIRNDGTRSGGQANKASSHEKSLETETNWFIINLKGKQVMADNFCRP